MRLAGLSVHALDSGFHSGILADAQIPAAVTRDAEWTGIDFLTATPQAILTAERPQNTTATAQNPGNNLVKTADQIVNNSTTPVNITGLSLTDTNVNDRWKVDCHLVYTSSATADIQVRFDLPAGATFDGIVEVPSTASVYTIGAITEAGIIAGGLAATEANCHFSGILRIGSPGGACHITFAQDQPEVSDTTIKAGSWVKYERVN